ncbi:MAG: sodium:proton antiporter [Dehalococcoidales bacterium]|jgi:multicomponent Na+:H+ antiporter subunit B|nr:sodium:proton antiporter [Dehalococcoidales bacterium]MDP6576820.1 MnhB domain-containing protein [Dehalococcoidales bacterium]MDP6825476.1 MnhB domain-containing protein [Dehalococcoidales bacterium]
MIRQRYQSIIIQSICSLLIPFIQLFAIYVILHGHYGPGGGFQGGVLLAVSVLLQRLYLGKEVAYQKFPPKLALALGAVGMLIFGLAGIVPMAFGGSFLDYAYLPLPGVSGAELRYLGILIVELGIGLAVFGTLVLIFDNFIGGRW